MRLRRAHCPPPPGSAGRTTFPRWGTVVLLAVLLAARPGASAADRATDAEAGTPWRGASSSSAPAAVGTVGSAAPDPGGTDEGRDHRPADRRDTVIVRDDLGRTLRFPSPPERIVSLVPAFTEILFALGAGDRLVGRTRYGVHPPAAREVASVGEGVRPSLEAVMARDPDVVLLFAGSQNRGTAERLGELEVPTLAFRHDSFGDLYRNLRRLGRLTGRDGAARRLEDRLRCQLAAVSRATEGTSRRRVYYEVWADPPVTVGRGSYLDSLLTVAGAENVFGELEAPSPRVSLEAIADRGPELILWPGASGGEGWTPPGERAGWRVLEAVREGRVRVVDGELVHRLGPRLGEAARALAALVHPGREAEVDEELRSAGCEGERAGRRDGAAGAGS